VTVQPEKVLVEYVRVSLPGTSQEKELNYSYVIPARR